MKSFNKLSNDTQNSIVMIFALLVPIVGGAYCLLCGFNVI